MSLHRARETTSNQAENHESVVSLLYPVDTQYKITFPELCLHVN